MIGHIRRYVIRKRFTAMVKVFDEKIEEARKAHQPVAHLIRAKREYVHERLAGSSQGGRNIRWADTEPQSLRARTTGSVGR